MQKVVFTGEFSELKGKGFTFQKLYCGNVMQWEKAGIRVWKAGSRITCDEHSLLDILNCRSAYGTSPNSSITMYYHYREDVRVYVSLQEARVMSDEWHKWVQGDKLDVAPPSIHTTTIYSGTVAVIDELIANKWLTIMDESI